MSQQNFISLCNMQAKNIIITDSRGYCDFWLKWLAHHLNISKFNLYKANIRHIYEIRPIKTISHSVKICLVSMLCSAVYSITSSLLLCTYIQWSWVHIDNKWWSISFCCPSTKSMRITLQFAREYFLFVFSWSSARKKHKTARHVRILRELNINVYARVILSIRKSAIFRYDGF